MSPVYWCHLWTRWGRGRERTGPFSIRAETKLHALIMTEGALELTFKETVREAVNNVLYSYYKYGATDSKKVLITSNKDFGIVCKYLAKKLTGEILESYKCQNPEKCQKSELYAIRAETKLHALIMTEGALELKFKETVIPGLLRRSLVIHIVCFV